jgi:hypothetical protein
MILFTCKKKIPNAKTYVNTYTTTTDRPQYRKYHKMDYKLNFIPVAMHVVPSMNIQYAYFFFIFFCDPSAKRLILIHHDKSGCRSVGRTAN